MKFIFRTFFIATMLLLSCQSDNSTKELEEAFRKEEFDQYVLNNFSLYDSLKNVFIANIDTIFNYRDSINGTQESSYNFIYPYPYMEHYNKVSSTTIPPFLFCRIEKLFQSIRSASLESVLVFKNPKAVLISIKSNTDKKANIITSHMLFWNLDFGNNNDPFIKDTVLAPGWIYRISSGIKPQLR